LSRVFLKKQQQQDQQPQKTDSCRCRALPCRQQSTSASRKQTPDDPTRTLGFLSNKTFSSLFPFPPPFPEKRHLHAMVEDNADLTTLVGEGDRHKQLVSTLFSTKIGDAVVGHVEWQRVETCTKDAFVVRCGNHDPGVEDLLRGWMTECGLEGKFEGQVAERKKLLGFCLFVHC